ncbi:uncharacterized protein LOC143283878 [Babylonia areolata]|uniref:uncharacterized protein LOC143283878 n=1 Tax=Babylonia areolata TaxID=304850 RepID=UPI003FD5CBD8
MIPTVLKNGFQILLRKQVSLSTLTTSVQWTSFLPRITFQLIADQSNLYAEELLSGITELSQYSRLNAAKDITVPEMKAYTALQITMGLCCKPEIKYYWWTYWLLNLPFGTIINVQEASVSHSVL